MPFESLEIGRVESDDLVLFGRKQVREIARKLGVSEDVILARYAGIPASLGGSPGPVGVDRMEALGKDGTTYPVVVLGADPNNFLGLAEETTGDDI